MDVQGGRVHIDPVHVLVHEGGQRGRGLGIIAEGDLVSRQLVETGQRFLIRLSEGILPDEPVHLVHGHEQVGNHDRIVVHVGSAHIQQPDDFVQGG